jgi:hypothetical protein
MSTKLHHAFALHLDLAAPEAVRLWLDQAKATLNPVADTTLRRWLVRQTVLEQDRSQVYGLPTPAGGFLDAVYQDGQRRLERAHEGRREPEVDVGVSVVLITDPEDDSLHGLYFIENDAMRQAFLALPGVVPTPYQNQTDDLPKGVTLAGWEARRALWERLIPRGVPGDAGITIELVPTPRTLPALRAEDIQANLLSLEQRVHRVVPEAIAQEMTLAVQAGGEALTSRRAMDFALECFPPDHPLRPAMTEQLTGWLANTPAFPVPPADSWATKNAAFIEAYNARIARGEMSFAEFRGL